MKRIIALILLCYLHVSASFAAELIINGAKYQEAVDSFSYDGNRIIIVTKGANQPQPTPTPPVMVDNGGVCKNSASIVCGRDFPWADGGLIRNATGAAGAERITIPAGKTHVARFVTTSDPRYGMAIVSQPPAGSSFSVVHLWISETPGGAALPKCMSSITIEGILKVFQFEGHGCAVQPNRTYFLNMKHANAGSPSSVIDRKGTAAGQYGGGS